MYLKICLKNVGVVIRSLSYAPLKFWLTARYWVDIIMFSNFSLLLFFISVVSFSATLGDSVDVIDVIDVVANF